MHARGSTQELRKPTAAPARTVGDVVGPGGMTSAKQCAAMGVIAIITFFIMLPIVAIMLGPFSLGLWETVALAIAAALGGGGLLATLYLIEPRRLEEGQQH